jgi:hypothetical protein
MQGFSGFPEGKLRTVPVPEPFFAELLPGIDHLGELKVTLYAFWRLSLMEGKYRFLRRDDLARDDMFMHGLSASPRLAQEILDDALERAEARGTLLYVSIEDAAARHDLYFVNSPKGREAVEKLTAGEWRPEEHSTGAVTLSHVRSNIFVLYEQNIGPLTPLIADELRDVMATYPGPWIEDAIRIAARNNIRKLKYILAVLDRMKAEGRHEREDPADPESYIKGYEGYLPFIGE